MDEDNTTETPKYLGLLFALCSSFFIGSYWVVNKYSLNKISLEKEEEIENRALDPPMLSVFYKGSRFGVVFQFWRDFLKKNTKLEL